MTYTTQRIYIFDNAKALLILLVVLGHAADYYTSQYESLRTFFIFTYLFHMPLFIFIAGLFSKSTINKDPFRSERVLHFFTLYFVMEVLFYLLRHFVLGEENFRFNPFVEDGVPWFMFAMGVWLILGRLFRGTSPLLVLMLSVIGMLLIGYFPIGDQLVTSRIIAFFPFFIAGYYTDPKQLAELLQSTALKIISWVLLVLTAITIWANIDKLYGIRLMLSGRNPYEAVKMQLDVPGGDIFLKLVITMITICLSIAILSIVSKKHSWFTTIGERSLAIYFSTASFYTCTMAYT
ncbi:acyltransferase family protein [Kurthia senegalensis]|uniref:acyltransferase family protein n=1 Tax=Kurthia senegalensis TaxID=1033740 RepID=UPI001375D438|nr:acyltransferase family protein [Kurthia senegalensis]